MSEAKTSEGEKSIKEEARDWDSRYSHIYRGLTALEGADCNIALCGKARGGVPLHKRSERPPTRPFCPICKALSDADPL